MTTSDYINRRYGSNRNRHWWGIAHRNWLVSSGRYVYTTRPSERAMRGTKTGIANLIVGELGPELVGFQPGGITPSPTDDTQDPRLNPRPGEHIIHPDGRAWTVGE